MGIIVHKETERNSELNDRIAADLRERAQETSQISDPDLVEDTDYTKDLKKTSRFGWIWMVLVVLALASLAFIVLI